MIELSPHDLYPHPRESSIYGDNQDATDLAAKIKESGWIAPLVVSLRTGRHVIISGHRRWLAALELQLPLVPVEAQEFVTEEEELEALLLHNLYRDKTREQKVREGDIWRELETSRARLRQLASQNNNAAKAVQVKLPEQGNGQTRDFVSAKVGMKPSTYDRARKVVEQADALKGQGDRDKAQELLSVLNEKSVDAAHKMIRKERQQAREYAALALVAENQERPWNITPCQEVVSCTALITDPPYGILDEPWEPQELESFTREWLKRWNACQADFIVSFWSQAYLFEGRRWFDEELSNYHFQQLLVWHYPNNKGPQSRQGFKQTWEPVYFYRRLDSEKLVGVGGSEWGDGLNDFDCHVAATPQSNFNDVNTKQHPAQKPLSVMRWLVNALTQPGDMICDPFCGSGTTGVAAVQLSRLFHGVEISQEYRALAERRISTYGNVS